MLVDLPTERHMQNGTHQNAHTVTAHNEIINYENSIFEHE